MKLEVRDDQGGEYQRVFKMDPAGEDEMILIPGECKGAWVFLSYGSDYGSGVRGHYVDEDTYQQIIGDNPPFTSSYEAQLWMDKLVTR